MMRRTRLFVVGAVVATGLAVVGAAPVLAATDVTIEFTATVATVDDSGGVLGGAISPGDTLTGTYTYDLDTPDTNSAPYVGDYRHAAAPYGMQVFAGGLEFATDPSNVDFLVELVNDHPTSTPPDSYVLHSYNNLPLPDGAEVDHISWTLVSESATAIDGTSLPATPPVLSDWDQQLSWGLTLDGSRLGDNARYHVRALVDSVAFAGGSVDTCAEVTTSGDVTGPSAAPASLGLGARESVLVQVFAERNPDVVASDLPVDFDSADMGSTINASGAGGGVIPAGTYCTFLLHLDPPGTDPLDASGTVTFSAPIAGGLLTDAGLNGSDADHGAPGTTYFTGEGRAVDDGDSVTFSSPHTLTLDMTGLNVVDNLRVWVPAGVQGPITSFNGVAAPNGTVVTNSTVSAADPIGTSVLVPTGGPVSIAEAASPAGGAPVGYSLGQVAVDISAPAQTAAAPLVFTFVLYPSVLPLVPDGSGGTRPATADELLILRNSAPVGSCPGSTVAAPNPCVTAASTAPDGTATITVLTSDASVWTVAAPTEPVVATLGDVTVAEGATTHLVDVPVTLSRPLATATTVTASVSGAGTRVPAQSVLLSIAAGETTGALPVSVAGNTVDDPDVVATVTLTGAPGADIGSPPNAATLTVIDDDLPAPPAVVDPCPGGLLRPALKNLLKKLGLGALVCLIP
jgi:hypothetical protein